MATPNYEIDYNDKRFTDITDAKDADIKTNNTFYDKTVNDITTAIDTQKTNAENWGTEQAKNQQAQHDFTIQQIEQNKAQAQQDYKKEQTAAYVDWQKQSNKYGANAEQMAAQGMRNTGYSESSQVAMYNQYQNRVAVAREAMVRANTEFENQITQAKLQNSSILAEIAYNTLKEVSALTLSGIQQTTALRREQMNRDTELKQIYHNQWQDVLKQIIEEQKQAYISPDTTIEEPGGGSSGGHKYTGSTTVTESSGTKVGSGSSTIDNSNHKATNTTTTKTDIAPAQKPSTPYPKYSVAGALQGMSTLGNKNIPKVDKSALANKGYGDLSAKELADMVNKGVLVPVTKNGKIEFQKPLSSGAGTKQWLTQHMK